MTLRSRLQRLVERAQQKRQADAPHLTMFLVEAGPGRPVGTRTDWDGQALEITFDPTHGPPTLPPGGPHKIVLGPIFEIRARRSITLRKESIASLGLRSGAGSIHHS